MLPRTAFLFFLVLTACSLAAGQGSHPPTQDPPPTTQAPPPPLVVKPDTRTLGSIPLPKLPDSQAQPQPDNTAHLKPADLDSRQSLNDGTKMQLIRVMD